MNWQTLALLHVMPTLFMTGVIWFVQVVHYPLLSRIGDEAFVAYERQHCRRTTFVVLPAMILELVMAVWLCVAAPAAHSAWTSAGLALVAIAWMSTFLLQVPCHQRLSNAQDHAIIARLVASNWLRTIAWSLRSVVAVALVWRIVTKQ